MIEVFKALGKNKIFSGLVILQLMISMLYFFVVAAAIQESFFTNVIVPKELDADAEQIVHIEIGVDIYSVDKDISGFISDIEKSGLGDVGTYDEEYLFFMEFGGDVSAIAVDRDITGIKDIVLEQGEYFTDSDFVKDETKGTYENPISILIGKSLENERNAEIGSIIYDDYTERYYKIKGVLEKESKWFCQHVSDGMISDLDGQVIIPIFDEEDIQFNHYLITKSGDDKEVIKQKVEDFAKKYDIDVVAKYISDELDESFEESYNENKFWLVFALALLVMVSIGTTILFVAQMDYRKHEIGIRIAVGYSIRRIIRQLYGQVMVICSIAFAIAIGFARMLIGGEVKASSGVAYSNGHYLSIEIIIIGVILMCMMCLPAIIALWIQAKRLQPRELIGGNE